MATVAHLQRASDPESTLDRLSTIRLLGQFATPKLTGANQCRSERGGCGWQRQEGFDVRHPGNAFRVMQAIRSLRHCSAGAPRILPRRPDCPCHLCAVRALWMIYGSPVDVFPAGQRGEPADTPRVLRLKSHVCAVKVLVNRCFTAEIGAAAVRKIPRTSQQGLSLDVHNLN
jgi:hypothetical protein